MKITLERSYVITLTAEEYKALRPAISQLSETLGLRQAREGSVQTGVEVPFVAGAEVVIAAPKIAASVDEEAANARLLDAIRTDRIPSLDELAELERRPRPTSVAGQQVAPLLITPSGESPSSTETTARILPTPRGKVAHDLHAAQAKAATRGPAKDGEPMSHFSDD